MKCPFCSNEMVLGYIQCRDGVVWTPRKQPVAALSALARGSVTISNGAVEHSRIVYAHKCSACKKIVIDYAPVTD